MLKDISISVGKIKVAGLLEAEPNSITVQIQSPFRNLKAGEYLSNAGMGYHRYVHNGKLSSAAIEIGEEILKGLYLAGQYLRDNPEFIERLQKYIARFEKQAKVIQKERQRLLAKLNEGEMTQKEYAAKSDEQQFAERRNVLERGSIFRRYADELTAQSGGRADIDSVLRFNLPHDESLTSAAQRLPRHHKKAEGKPLSPVEG